MRNDNKYHKTTVKLETITQVGKQEKAYINRHKRYKTDKSGKEANAQLKMTALCDKMTSRHELSFKTTYYVKNDNKYMRNDITVYKTTQNL